MSGVHPAAIRLGLRLLLAADGLWPAAAALERLYLLAHLSLGHIVSPRGMTVHGSHLQPMAESPRHAPNLACLLARVDGGVGRAQRRTLVVAHLLVDVADGEPDCGRDVVV